MAYNLSATKRTIKGEKVRESGMLPAVIYGAGQESVSLVLNYKDFNKLYNEAGNSSLIDLLLDGQGEGKVLVQEVQYDPVTDKVSHVDFRRVDMNKELTVMVELNFIGEAPAIKEQGGTLVKNLEEVEVKCLPKDLISEIEVGLTSLKTFSDIIRVKDLAVPAGVTISSPKAEDIVAKAVPALTEEQLKAMEASSADLSQIKSAVEKKEAVTEEGKEKVATGAEDKKTK